MPDLKWLEGYSGQSVDELIALASGYRVDSLVLAFEQALQQATSPLNETELTILAVEALKRIDCPKTAAVSALAISLLGLREPFTAIQIQAALDKDRGGKLIEILIDQCDRPYDDTGEPIADRLFAYIRANRDFIRLRK